MVSPTLFLQRFGSYRISYLVKSGKAETGFPLNEASHMKSQGVDFIALSLLMVLYKKILYIHNMDKLMDRHNVNIISQSKDSSVMEELSNLTVSDRFQTITYLRECFYGPEATTGTLNRRLQRVYRVFKQK